MTNKNMGVGAEESHHGFRRFLVADDVILRSFPGLSRNSIQKQTPRGVFRCEKFRSKTDPTPDLPPENRPVTTSVTTVTTHQGPSGAQPAPYKHPQVPKTTVDLKLPEPQLSFNGVSFCDPRRCGGAGKIFDRYTDFRPETEVVRRRVRALMTHGCDISEKF